MQIKSWKFSFIFDLGSNQPHVYCILEKYSRDKNNPTEKVRFVQSIQRDVLMSNDWEIPMLKA